MQDLKFCMQDRGQQPSSAPVITMPAAASDLDMAALLQRLHLLSSYSCPCSWHEWQRAGACWCCGASQTRSRARACPRLV